MITKHHTDNLTRTQDIYENHSNYFSPPVAEIPTLDILYEEYRIDPLSRAAKILKTVFRIIGFYNFLQKDKTEISALMKSTYARTGGMQAPVISATCALADDNNKTDQTTRAASLIAAAIEFAEEVSEGRLTPDTHNNQPLEMGQYPNIFGTQFIIEKGQCKLFKTNNKDHIVVITNRRFYRLQLPRQDMPATEMMNTIKAALDELITHSQTDASASHISPGVFTCCDANIQLNAFEKISKDKQNQTALDTIKNALFTLSLDQFHGPETDDKSMHIAHGVDLDNRWFYSSMQMVVFNNAKSAFIFSFDAYLDGQVMMRSSAEIQRRASQLTNLTDTQATQKVNQTLAVQPLCWSIDPLVYKQAHTSLSSRWHNQNCTFSLDSIGADNFKKFNVNPVTVFVLALILTGRNISGKTPNLYQILSMSKFKYLGLNECNCTNHHVDYLTDLWTKDIRAVTANDLIKTFDSIEQACSKARQFISIYELLAVYMNRQTKIARFIKGIIFGLTINFLQKKQVLREKQDIIISHPKIFTEVPWIGRPGVQLDYVTLFGMHYQIFSQQIRLTIMRSNQLAVSNAELVARLRSTLITIEEKLSGGDKIQHQG